MSLINVLRLPTIFGGSLVSATASSPASATGITSGSFADLNDGVALTDELRFYSAELINVGDYALYYGYDDNDGAVAIATGYAPVLLPHTSILLELYAQGGTNGVKRLAFEAVQVGTQSYYRAEHNYVVRILGKFLTAAQSGV